MTWFFSSSKKIRILQIVIIFFVFSIALEKIRPWNIFDNTRTLENAQTTIALVSTETKKTLSALRQLGFANMTLMKNLNHTRPLFDFATIPWKTGYIQNVKNSTEGQRWSMIVGIKSHAKNFEKRKAVRKTWGSYQHFRGVRLQIFFVIATTGDSEVELQILKENKKYGDLLQIEQRELYKHVGFKTLAAMQWVGDHFPAHWIYSSSDDDMMPNLLKMYDAIESLTSSPNSSSELRSNEDINAYDVSNIPIHCAFSLRDKRVPIRNLKIKNSVSIDYYSVDKYPTFCAGGFYSMPVKLCKQIYFVSRQHEYFAMDDVWITGLLRLAVVDYFGYYGCNKNDQYCAISQNGESSVQHFMRFNVDKFSKKWEVVEKTFIDKT